MIYIRAPRVTDQMSSSAANPTAAPRTSMRWLLPLLIAYALLALLGGVLRRPELSVIAAALLLIALAVPVLRRPSVAGVLLWLALAALLLIPAALGRVQLALAGLPIVILGALSWVFARSLAREPLIARCIRVIEGEQRLALPGVARYARGVTAYWAIVLGAQAVILAALWLLAKPGGVLDVFGVAVPFAPSRAALAWYPEIGCWAVLIAAFAAEYLYRRWRMRRIPHPPLKRFLTRLIQRWPQLLREEVSP